MQNTTIQASNPSSSFIISSLKSLSRLDVIASTISLISLSVLSYCLYYHDDMRKKDKTVFNEIKDDIALLKALKNIHLSQHSEDDLPLVITVKDKLVEHQYLHNYLSFYIKNNNEGAKISKEDFNKLNQLLIEQEIRIKDYQKNEKIKFIAATSLTLFCPSSMYLLGKFAILPLVKYLRGV